MTIQSKHEMGDSGMAGHGGTVSWTMAAQATLHCLTGCAIGEVLGMVVGTAFGWSNAATIVLAVVLAFVFGYALTMRGVLKAGLSLQAAFKVALAADTVSILIAFVLTTPVNRWMIGRGKGHAVVHQYHH